MSRRAAAVLGFGLGVVVAQPLGVACVLVAELLQRRNLR